MGTIRPFHCFERPESNAPPGEDAFPTRRDHGTKKCAMVCRGGGGRADRHLSGRCRAGQVQTRTVSASRAGSVAMTIPGLGSCGPDGGADEQATLRQEVPSVGSETRSNAERAISLCVEGHARMTTAAAAIRSSTRLYHSLLRRLAERGQYQLLPA